MTMNFDPDTYRIRDTTDLRTPALAIYPRLVDANIQAILRLCGGDPNRWRPHVKTSKLAYVMRRFPAHGIHQFKCATGLELQTLCELNAADVLLAYPIMGANVARAKELAARFPGTRVSSMVEDPAQVAPWRGGNVSLFIDVNPGMDRTGIDQSRADDIVALARAIADAGLAFRGLHYYDGQYGRLSYAERFGPAQAGYARLMELVDRLTVAGLAPGEVITSGTPAFPCALAFEPFRSAPFVHRVSPGTVVYNDTTTLSQLPAEFGLQPAAVVIAGALSHPAPNRFTCDAGHKAVAADAGVPTCAVIGMPQANPLAPSEEHLPVELPDGAPLPALGEMMYLVPRHVCPTINFHDEALIVENGQVIGVERVTARGHDSPLASKPRGDMAFVRAADAPAPGGHYSQAVVRDGLVFVAGQLPIDPVTGARSQGDIEAQTELALRNVAAILRAAGSGLDRVLSATVYVTDVGLWGGVNAAFARAFGAHRPARAVVPIGELHYGSLVEISVIAAA